jgi:hypothetical protein
MGLAIERDRFFEPKSLRELRQLHEQGDVVSPQTRLPSIENSML